MADDNIKPGEIKPDETKPDDVARTIEVHTERVGGVTEMEITRRREDEAGSTSSRQPPADRTGSTTTLGIGSPVPPPDQSEVPPVERRPPAEPQPSLAARAVGLAGYDGDVRRVGGAALTSLVSGLIIVALGAWQNWVAAIMWAGACSAVGWVLGFLFGIPRTLSTEGQSEALTQTTREAPAGNTTTRVKGKRTTGVNTNLEQISDWLTKILVGVTLVQLGEFSGSLDAGATLIAASLGGAASKSFAYALMMYFSLTGFLGSYLLTRLFLQIALQRATDEF